MNDLQELHIKGELSEKGFLKEIYDKNKGDLVHTLTEKGNKTTLELLRNKDLAREYLIIAGKEALKYDRATARKIIQEAINTVKEANK